MSLAIVLHKQIAIHSCCKPWLLLILCDYNMLYAIVVLLASDERKFNAAVAVDSNYSEAFERRISITMKHERKTETA